MATATRITRRAPEDGALRRHEGRRGGALTAAAPAVDRTGVDRTEWTVTTEGAATAIVDSVTTVATHAGAWNAATGAYSPGHVVSVRRSMSVTPPGRTARLRSSAMA